jgi:hypothetical protein
MISLLQTPSNQQRRVSIAKALTFSGKMLDVPVPSWKPNATADAGSGEEHRVRPAEGGSYVKRDLIGCLRWHCPRLVEFSESLM